VSILARLWRLPDWAQHSVIAAGWMLAVGLPWWVLGWSHPAIAGALVGIAFYYGREARDAENADPSLYDRLAVLWPGNWHRDMRSDFLWPLATNGALAAVIEAWVAWG
jgi:hypothetical protein